MRIALITQDIRDPISYSSVFLKHLQIFSQNKLELTVFSDKDKTFFKDLFCTKTLNFKKAFILSPCNHITNQMTQTNINKQIDVSKKLGRKATAQSLLIKHLQLLAFYQQQFGSLKFDLLLVWNGITHSFQTAGVEVARSMNIPVIFLERGLIPKSIFYDFEGINAESSIGKNPLWQEQPHLLTDSRLFSKIKEIVINTGGGLVAESSQTSMITLENYVFFPLQRDTDSNILFNSPYVKNMFSILSTLNSWIFQYQKNISILVRPHPEDPKYHYTKHLIFDNLIIQADGSLLETIEKSSRVMTVNSTIGFTSLIFDKPVIALGKSVYSGRALCAEPADIGELQTLLFDQQPLAITREMVSRRQDFVNKIVANNHISFEHADLLEIQTQAFQKQLECVLN